MQQITFNSSLLREMNSLVAMMRLSGPESQSSTLSRKLRRLRLHHIKAEKHVPGLTQANALDLDWNSLSELRKHSRAAAAGWLAQVPGSAKAEKV
jgi:NTE family protein